MNPLPIDQIDTIIQGNCLEVMKDWPDGCIDLLCSDPPYGIAFMGAKWDAGVPSVEVWQEALRVLKAGAFAFVMSSPRQDVFAQNIVNLKEAGFEMGFSSIVWCHAQGFPKAQNISKAIDKRAGAEREIIAPNPNSRQNFDGKIVDMNFGGRKYNNPITMSITPQAQAFDGSYGGYQPKPAVEVILVAMKPLSEKTFVDQALRNGKGITWLDQGRIPYESEKDKIEGQSSRKSLTGGTLHFVNLKGWNRTNRSYIHGRFPANLLVSDDVLDDGEISKDGRAIRSKSCGNNFWGGRHPLMEDIGYEGVGGFSRFFSLDAWWAERVKQLPPEVQKTFPFLIVPKAHKGEKNEGCGRLPIKQELGGGGLTNVGGAYGSIKAPANNHHPTVKPLKLMAYLITLGSREGDLILDPFVGSGTTAVACKMLGRHFIGIDSDPSAVEIANARVSGQMYLI